MTTNTLLAGAERFDIEEFKEFLKSRQEHQFIPANSCQCPIAVWLQSKWCNPPSKVDVMQWRAIIKQGDVEYNYSLPDWVRAFIANFDKLGLGNYKTGEKALDVLDIIEHDVE